MQAGLRHRSVLRSLRVGGVLAILVAAFTGFAMESSAQDSSSQARVSIAFPFVADGKEMPAGDYEFSVSSGRVVVRATSGKSATVTMTVITRLGRHDADPQAELVFDKEGNKSVLSELWLPGSDGYLLVHGTPDHKHQVVGGSKPRK